MVIGSHGARELCPSPDKSASSLLHIGHQCVPHHKPGQWSMINFSFMMVTVTVMVMRIEENVIIICQQWSTCKPLSHHYHCKNIVKIITVSSFIILIIMPTCQQQQWSTCKLLCHHYHCQNIVKIIIIIITVSSFIILTCRQQQWSTCKPLRDVGPTQAVGSTRPRVL